MGADGGMGEVVTVLNAGANDRGFPGGLASVRQG
jgi:hypothetical protein